MARIPRHFATGTGLSRRRLIATGAGLAAGTLASRARAQAGAPAADLLPHEQALYEAAKREGEVTWYQGQLSAEPSEAIGRAFTARFPGVKVNVVRSTSQVAFQRLSQDMRAGVAQCDVLSSTDYSHYTFLKRQGQLLQYRTENAEKLIQAARERGDPGFFHVTYLGIYLIGYNTQKVAAADLPKTWKDLLAPKYKNQLAVGHPGFSGAIGNLCVMMRKMYGEAWFKGLEKNSPQIGRSSEDPITLLNAGERTIGIGVPAAMTLYTASRGNPLAILYPEDGAQMVPSPSAMPKNAPHPNAAKLFMEFTASPAYFQASRAFFDLPLRSEVPPPPGAKPLDQVKLISPTPEEAETGIPEVKELWRDVFGV